MSTLPWSSRGDHDDAHARHHRAGGVRAVRAGRDQADVAVIVAARAVVAADREQPGELALGAGVRLQRHRVVAGDRDQPPLEVVDQPQVAVGLVERRERVDGRELRPGDRPPSRWSRSASSCRSRAGSSSGRAPRPGPTACAGSGASASRSGAARTPGGSGSPSSGAGRRGARRAWTRRARRSRTRTRNAAQTASICGRSVTSSQAIATVSASTRRRLTPRCRAAASTASAWNGTCTWIVSKNCVVHDRRARRGGAPRPGSRRIRWTRRAISSRPSRPW